MLAVVLVVTALMALLATLQYRWLGQISEAEQERMRATLGTGASELAQDLDRELTRAYLLFQVEPGPDQEISTRLSERYERWQATSGFPRLVKNIYVLSGEEPNRGLRQLDLEQRRLVPSDWPPSMADWEKHFAEREVPKQDPRNRAVVVARVTHPLWESVPAIVSPMPMPLLLLNDKPEQPSVRALFSYAIVTLDADYLKKELLPALAHRHFRRGGTPLDVHVAVVRTSDDGGVVFTSEQSFMPRPTEKMDASADLFQVRTQDFATLTAEVRRFAAFGTAFHAALPEGGWRPATPPDDLTAKGARPLSIIVQSAPASPPVGRHEITTTTRMSTIAPPKWKLMLKHRAGSLEAAVGSVRRRNLIISSSIIGVLAVSMGLLVISTRRAQRLARQQIEFVAAVSHELRTPLAVLRSAAENLADGVVHGEEEVKKYGDLMRVEGRRLTEMVEQILELSGIHSGQRGFALRAVSIEPLLHDILSSSASLLQRARVEIESAIPADVPPVLGDEAALRRVFQNLIDNAVKYGARGGWIGLTAQKSGSEVRVTIADRGMGISPTEQSRIFEPFYRAQDAVSAQIQGAGLGLSLVQRIVEAHGGRVSVRSTPGQGSEFIVHLPSAGEEPSVRTVGSAQPVSS